MAPDLSTDESLEAYAKVCPEVVLYFLIDQLGGLAWRLNHDANRDGARGNITEEEAKSMLESAVNCSRRAAICAAQSTRFGVDPVLVKRPSAFNPSKEIEVPSDSYWAWFRWWNAYVKGLGDGEFRQMDDDMIADRDLSRWRPQGDWRAPSPPLSEQQPATTA